MWTVDKAVERFEGKNVNSSYPQNLQIPKPVQVEIIHEKSQMDLVS